MGSGVFRGFYEQTIPLALGFVGGMAAVGWYSAAARLVGTAVFLPYALTTALLPTLSRLWTEDKARFASLSRRMFALAMLMAVPVSLVLFCLPEQLIAVLRYDSFTESIPVLRVGGITTLLFFASFALGTTIIAADRQTAMLRAAVVALVAGAPACTLAMWVSHRLVGNAALGGMIGAAAVEALLIALYFRALPVRLIDGAVVSLLLRYVLASMPAGVLLWWCAVRGIGLWAVLPCAALYVGACLAMRAVDPAAVTALRGGLAVTAAALRRGIALAAGGPAAVSRTR
jgi:O-antigen/teichoic acid export membrane protein